MPAGSLPIPPPHFASAASQAYGMLLYHSRDKLQGAGVQVRLQGGIVPLPETVQHFAYLVQLCGQRLMLAV